MTIVVLIVSLLAILASAVVFTNAVEMLGDRLDLGGGAVGSILAAVGTALPETMIPLLAIISALFTGGSTAGAIGVGAIIGAPFLLATLGMFVVGASALGFRKRRENGIRIEIDEDTTRRDMRDFLIFFVLAALAGIVPLPFYVKVTLAVLLLAGYALYVRNTLKSGGGEEEEAPLNLWLWPSRSGAPNWAVVGQLLVTIAVMAVGAHFFVTSVEHLSHALGIPAGLIALVLAPLATELPEKFNSIYWLRDDKDTLAFGNIAGAMVFQSTIPVFLGLVFTPWNLGFLNILAVGLALFSGAVLYAMIRGKRPLRAELLVCGGVLYAVFVVVAIFAIFLGW